jgi:plasmid stabilization system protein ParE
MKPLEYHPESRSDAREAVDWYRNRSQMADLDFSDELKATLARLREAPQACSPYPYGTRRILLN